jgi:hypothetical protein
MSISTIPFVAIIGGFSTLNSAQAKDAQNLAEEIGAELAKAGMGLVVYFSENWCLEPYVVSGYIKGLPGNDRANLIRVRYAESQIGKVKFLEEDIDERKKLFDPKKFPSQDWEAPFYRSLIETDDTSRQGVDAILLMAGGRSTCIAGQIALARPIPVLAVEKFGGAAGKIWTELATRLQDYPSSSTQKPEQLVKWLKDQCIARAKQSELARHMEQTYLKVTSQNRKCFWAICAFAVLLITIFLGMTQTPILKLYPIFTFLGLIAAGATGSIVRSIIWGAEETSSSTSLVLGGIAGFIVGLAYLIPQWVGAPGFLKPEAQLITETDKIQFVSAVLVAISAGVGFDTVFTRMKKQIEEQPISIPK